MEKAQGRLWWI